MKIDKGAALLIAVLALFLVFSTWMALDIWTGIDTEIGFHGIVAIVLGGLGSILLGGGLMFLVYYSHRHHYDERAHDDHG